MLPNPSSKNAASWALALAVAEMGLAAGLHSIHTTISPDNGLNGRNLSFIKMGSSRTHSLRCQSVTGEKRRVLKDRSMTDKMGWLQ